jgi:hypothetical protein
MMGLGAQLGFSRRRIASQIGRTPIPMSVIFDPRALGSMRQEITGAAATTPVAIGQPVGSMLNLGSAGGWATAPTTGARPILNGSGGRYWLEGDGVDDSLNLPSALACRYLIAGGQYQTGSVALANIVCFGQNTAGSAVRLNAVPDGYNQTDAGDHNFGGSNTINGSATLSVAINTDHVVESLTDGTDRQMGTLLGAVTLSRFWKGRMYPVAWNPTIPSAGDRLLLRKWAGLATGVTVI